jgi:hypothetical protein
VAVLVRGAPCSSRSRHHRFARLRRRALDRRGCILAARVRRNQLRHLGAVRQRVRGGRAGEGCRRPEPCSEERSTGTGARRHGRCRCGGRSGVRRPWVSMAAQLPDARLFNSPLAPGPGVVRRSAPRRLRTSTGGAGGGRCCLTKRAVSGGSLAPRPTAPSDEQEQSGHRACAWISTRSRGSPAGLWGGAWVVRWCWFPGPASDGQSRGRGSFACCGRSVARTGEAGRLGGPIPRSPPWSRPLAR